jgi:hypothetical protein
LDKEYSVSAKIAQKVRCLAKINREIHRNVHFALDRQRIADRMDTSGAKGTAVE